MTHHTMNQMGHEFPNMVGMKPGDLEEKIRPLLPAYMTMGHTGMDMGRMAEAMPYPPNTIAMKGATGPFEDPRWYQHPPGTVVLKATEADLARDGIDVSEATTAGRPSAPEPATPKPVPSSGPSTPVGPAGGHRR